MSSYKVKFWANGLGFIGEWGSWSERRPGTRWQDRMAKTI